MTIQSSLSNFAGRALCVTVWVFLALPPTSSVAVEQGKGNAPIDTPSGGFLSNEWKEEAPQFPKPPLDKDLVEFKPRGRTLSAFFVDGPSLGVGGDAVVRFSLVIRNPAGGRQVMYVGVRCKTHEWKTYGGLRPEGRWNEFADPQWHRILSKGYNDYEQTLVQDYLCTGNSPAADARALLAGLRLPGARESHH